VKVLITRTDRLGDLVLSLPVFGWLKAARPDWEVHAMVGPAAVPLVEHHPGLDGVWTWTGNESEPESSELENRLRSEGFDAVVLLQYRRELAQLVRRAGIARRFGPRSKISSWFLLNRGLRQGRSRGLRHEADFNLELVRSLVPDSGTTEDTLFEDHPGLYLSGDQFRTGVAFREQEAPEARQVAFVHPGSGGSALDWEPARFAEVANGLARKDGWRVFITGSPADQVVIDLVRPFLASEVAVLAGRYDLPDFLGVLSGGDLMVGPSTGPLHLAAALGLAAVGLYPPVVTMSPERWGPRGPWVRALTPPVVCPARRVCTEKRCPHYNCMNRIGTEEVLATVNDLARAREVAS
jgi:ADP-heptose:LPS heptosyltransferase